MAQEQNERGDEEWLLDIYLANKNFDGMLSLISEDEESVETVLAAATEKDWVELVVHLLDTYPDIRDCPYDIVEGASSSNSFDVLLELDRRFGLSTNEIQDTLKWSCRYANEPMADFALFRGAKPDGVGYDDMSYLHLLVGYNRISVPNKPNRIVIARKLLKLGAPLESRDRWGNTPLHMAARNGDFEYVKFLVEEAGANVKAIKVNGIINCLPYEVAKTPEIEKYLKDAAEDPLTKGANEDGDMLE